MPRSTESGACCSRQSQVGEEEEEGGDGTVLVMYSNAHMGLIRHHAEVIIPRSASTGSVSSTVGSQLDYTSLVTANVENSHPLCTLG